MILLSHLIDCVGGIVSISVLRSQDPMRGTVIRILCPLLLQQEQANAIILEFKLVNYKIRTVEIKFHVEQIKMLFFWRDLVLW